MTADTATSRSPTTLFAEFDAEGGVIASNFDAFETDAEAALTAYLARFVEIDGDAAPEPETIRDAWRRDEAALEARTAEDEWRLLSSHATAGGGRCLLSIDITPAKARSAAEGRRGLALLNEALRSLSIGFAVFDADGRLLLSNDMFAALNAGLREFVTHGVHWETLLREMARRKIPLRSAGREAAWVAQMLEASEGFGDVELARTDGSCLAMSIRPAALGGFIVSQWDVSATKAAERSARDSEQMLSQILEASPANLCMSRIGSGEILYQSPSCAALFGVEASAKAQFADRKDRADFLTELLPSGRIDNVPATARNADGAAFPALFSARVVEFKGEEVMVSTVTDLTEQQAAQRAALDAGARLRDAIDSIDEGFALYDADGRLRLWNKRYAALHAHWPKPLTAGVSHRELTEAEIASGRLGETPESAARARAMAAGFLRRDEFRLGGDVWHAVSRNPTSDGGFVVTRLDISERKRAEAAQREADEWVAKMLDTCPIAINVTRRDTGEVVFRGGAADALYGPNARAEDYWVDLEERRRFRALLTRDGKVDGLEARLRRADGSAAPTLLSARPVDYRGEAMVVAFMFDLTERTAMERELAKQRDMLHQSEKLSALGELLAGVAHELNNPLSVVVGHALMLQEEAQDGAQRRRAEKIGSAAERCSRIVKTFLAMARQRPATLERVDVRSVVETALDVAGYGLRSKGASVVVDAPGSDAEAGRSLCVVADADQLAQVFANLIVNAEHALAEKGPAGMVRIAAARAEGRDEGCDEVVVTVSDNGPGIPEAIRARIFEPFFTTKGVGHGTGVGLAFCHRIVETHGGRIAVDEGPEGGARFTLHLPLAAGDPEQAHEAASPASTRRGRALVVDDEDDVAELFSQVLASVGFAVDTAASAEAALERLGVGADAGAAGNVAGDAAGDAAVGDYDLILSDLNMPGLGGRALLDRIRASRPTLERRLGFITGDTMSPGVGAFLREAGRPYLEKPAAPEDVRRLAAALTADRREEAPT